MNLTSSVVAGLTRLVLLLVLAVLAGGKPIQAAIVQPAPDSPLASDGSNVYAVGLDRQSILVARGGRSSWVQLALLHGAKLRGMVWANSRLYLTNAADSSVISINPSSGDRVPTVVHKGPPLTEPGELALADSLFVADAAAGTLFRMARSAGAKAEFGSPVAVDTPFKIDPTTFISGWAGGELMVSHADSGLLAQVIDEGAEVRFRAMQQRLETGTETAQWNQTPGRMETLRRSGYPGVDHPTAIAVYNGILYVTDAKSGHLFAAGVFDARAIRVPKPVADVPITRLHAGPIAITALDAKGQIHILPRTVPAELTLLPTARPQHLFPVIEYLHRRRLLLTKSLRLTGSLDETLTAARMQWPARSASAEPETPEGKYASFCLLNPQHCVDRLPRPNLTAGTPIVMADLYAERFTSATQAILDGKRTLGAVADAAVISAEFESAKSEANLRRLNGIAKDAPDVRAATTGTYRISQELVRYVIPIEATELRSFDNEFSRLQERTKATLRIAPLERVMTTMAHLGADTKAAFNPRTLHDPQHPNDPQCIAARQAMEELRRAVNYIPVAPGRTVLVGVAEDDFDLHHRDFFDAGSNQSILYLVTDASELTPAPNDGPQTLPPDAEPVDWRKFDEKDHGTAVASLIAGRRRPWDKDPGMTTALIGMFTRTTDMTALAQDIERALNQSNMSIVNLSLRNRGRADAPTLRVLMESKQALALFIVAAPNSPSQIKLCTGQDVFFPACHGDKFENVLVVGGTTLRGDAIHQKSPIGLSVHIFAPEAGYFSAGRQNGYVPVEGTSFATAIVSAAAALLSNAGISSPGLIKQRLIATADVMNLPDRPQWARLLNVKRALRNLTQAVLVDANTDQDVVVDINNKNESLRFKIIPGNRGLVVPLGDIRRLRRVPGNSREFDLAYVVPRSEVVDGLRNETLILQRVSADGELRACPMPRIGSEACINLAEYKDYVAPIQ